MNGGEGPRFNSDKLLSTQTPQMSTLRFYFWATVIHNIATGFLDLKQRESSRKDVSCYSTGVVKNHYR